MTEGGSDQTSDRCPFHQKGSTWRGHLLAVSFALLGGALGIGGAFIQEAGSGGLFLPFVAGPIIEETLKPIGVYLILVRCSHLLRSQLYTATLTGLSGLAFGAVESAVYVTLYFPEGGSQFVLYRFTVPLIMHTIASFIVGWGINRKLLDSVRGEIPLLEGSRRFFIGGILLHALFNISVTGLSVASVLDVT